MHDFSGVPADPKARPRPSCREPTHSRTRFGLPRATAIQIARSRAPSSSQLQLFGRPPRGAVLHLGQIWMCRATRAPSAHNPEQTTPSLPTALKAYSPSETDPQGSKTTNQLPAGCPALWQPLQTAKALPVAAAVRWRCSPKGPQPTRLSKRNPLALIAS